MDLLTLVLAAGGLALAASGYPIVGGTIYALPLVSLPIAIMVRTAQKRRVPTLLPFSFFSYVVIAIAAIVVAIPSVNTYPMSLVVGLAICVYYLVCVSLNERRVRYRGGGVADAKEQPVIYGLMMLVFSSLAVLLLGFVLLLVIRGA